MRCANPQHSGIETIAIRMMQSPIYRRSTFLFFTQSKATHDLYFCDTGIAATGES